MTVVVDGGDGADGAQAAEAGAEAAEAVAEAAETVAEAAGDVADAAAEVADGGDGGEGGGESHTDGDLAQAMVIGAGLQALNDHLGNEDVHHSTEDIRAQARSVLWEEAESLAQYAADLAAESAAPDEGETIVVPDVTDDDKRETGLRRFL